jgi:DNA-binding MltR family transcriptional regulator
VSDKNSKSGTGPQSEDRATTIARSLVTESDRGCIVIGVALLDETLVQNLHRAFRQDPVIQKKVVDPLFEASGPLNSLAHRINFAYALGMISPEVHHDLHALRRLRNEVAHLYGPTSFQDPQIRSRINSLKIAPTLTNPPRVNAPQGAKGHSIKQWSHEHSKEIFIERLAFMLALAHLNKKILDGGKIYATALFRARSKMAAMLDRALRKRRNRKN